MKKLFLFFACILLSFQLYAAGETLIVFPPEISDISSGDQSWLPLALRDKLESDFKTYTSYQIMADNIQKIHKLQKLFESASYDESTAVEAGKLTASRYALLSSLRKSGKHYVLSANFLDIKTGEKLASVLVSSATSIEELYISSPNSVDQLFIKLCEQLKINLTAGQKHILTYGDQELSLEQQLAYARQEEENFKKQILACENQIQSLNKARKSDSESEILRLKAEQALAQERLDFSREQAQKLQLAEKQRLQDLKEDEKRSAMQKARRDKLIEELEKKEEKVRSLKNQSENVYEHMVLLEDRKKALLEERKLLENRIKEIKQEGQVEYEQKKKEIYSEAYRSGEMVDGKPTQAALERRQEKVDSELASINERTKREVDQLVNIFKKQENSLIVLMNRSKDNLEKEKTVSSFSQDFKISYASYDAEKMCWNLYVYFYLNSDLIFKDSLKLYYSQVSSKKFDPENASDADYASYLDTVDMYSSLFNRGENVFYGEISYKVIPYDEDFPSKYKFVFTSFKLKDVMNNKTVASPKLTNSYASYQILPALDLRQDKKLYDVHVKSDQELEKERIKKAKQDKADKKQKEFKQMLDKSDNYFKVDLSYIPLLSKDGFSSLILFGLDFPLYSNLFWGLNVGYADFVNPDADAIFFIDNNRSAFLNAELGLNFNLWMDKWELFPLNFYTKVGLGALLGDSLDLTVEPSIGLSWFIFSLDFTCIYSVFENSFHTGLKLAAGWYYSGKKVSEITIF
ncbi:MAG: hypothetical protein K5839_01785 [Treponemataceae bacterium]|nr:hypothetical protein [Treponemataceae bacterium]